MEVFGFWIFIAACVVAGIWEDSRKKETEHETLRRIIESGRAIDQDLVNQILRANPRPDRDYKIAGMITLSVAPGLVLLGLFVGDDSVGPLLGVGALVACIGVGLLVASRMVAGWNAEDEAALKPGTMVQPRQD